MSVTDIFYLPYRVIHEKSIRTHVKLLHHIIYFTRFYSEKFIQVIYPCVIHEIELDGIGFFFYHICDIFWHFKFELICYVEENVQISILNILNSFYHGKIKKRKKLNRFCWSSLKILWYFSPAASFLDPFILHDVFLIKDFHLGISFCNIIVHISI
jgi:hypothetical protein